MTYDDGRVGEVVDGQVSELDVPTMPRYFELGGDVQRTGRSRPLDGVTLRLPIIPRDFDDCGCACVTQHDRELGQQSVGTISSADWPRRQRSTRDRPSSSIPLARCRLHGVSALLAEQKNRY